MGSSSTTRSWVPRSSAASEHRRRSPPDRPTTARSRVTPGQQHLDDLAGARVGGPLVVGPVGEHRLADGVGVLEGVALVQVADLEAAGPRHPAGVGLLQPGHHLEQRGLAVAVAADDADPLPRRDAERDLGQQRADAVRLRHPLQVDEVRHQPGSTTWAPGAGPYAVSTVSCPAPIRPPATARAWSPDSQQEDAGRARPGDHAAQRTLGLTALDQVPEVGAEVDRGRLQVVVQRRGQRGGRPGGQRLQHQVRRRRVAARRRGAARPSAGRPRGSRGARRRDGHHDPGPGPDVGHRGRPARRGRCRAPYRRRARRVRRSRRRPPRRAGSSSSHSRSHSRSAATRAAAASAEPPAMPPATGISLRIARSALR